MLVLANKTNSNILMLELLRHTQTGCQLQNYLFTLLMCTQHTVNHVLNKLTSRSCYSIIYKYHNQSINLLLYSSSKAGLHSHAGGPHGRMVHMAHQLPVISPSSPQRITTSTAEVWRQYVKKGKGSPYSITEHWVPELIPVLGSQPAGDVSHKPSGRLPLLSARPTVTLHANHSATERLLTSICTVRNELLSLISHPAKLGTHMHLSLTSAYSTAMSTGLAYISIRVNQVNEFVSFVFN